MSCLKLPPPDGLSQGGITEQAPRHVVCGHWSEEWLQIGFDYANSKVTRSHSNMMSANKKPQVVDEYLQHEIE